MYCPHLLYKGNQLPFLLPINYQNYLFPKVTWILALYIILLNINQFIIFNYLYNICVGIIDLVQGHDYIDRNKIAD